MTTNTDTVTPVLWRDRFVCAVSNWLFRHVASAWYRNMIDGSVRYGLMAAARDASQIDGSER